MSKHYLKIKGELLPCHTKVLVTVLEQTHRGKEFGPTPVRAESSTFVYGDLRLGSARRPNWFQNGGSRTNRTTALYVWGGNELLDERQVEVPIENWPNIREAVNAYNEWGLTQ